MPRFIIKETATYVVEADSVEEAENIFLEDIQDSEGRIEFISSDDRAIYMEDSDE